MAEFALTIIGSGSALTMHGRHPSAQVVQYEDLCCLIDCGEGTQERLRSAGIRPFRINLILISHLHGDHIFGLPGLLSSFTHLNRSEVLTIYGPAGLKGFLSEIIRYTELKLSYPLEIVETTPQGLISLEIRGNLEILTFPLFHRIACNGYLIREVTTVIRINKERIRDLNLKHEQLQALQRGQDIEHEGIVTAYGTLTHEPLLPISYAYCSDTRNDTRLINWIRGVSVLYFETTFMNDLEEMAQKTGHSTSGDAGRIARDAGVSCLITGHYSSRYKDIGKLVAEAGEIFQHAIMAEEGKRYNLRNLSRGLC